MRYKRRFVITISNRWRGVYIFFECFVVTFALYAYLKNMFVPSVLVNYEYQSDGESRDERQSNVQQIFACTKTGSYKSFRKILICIFNTHVYRRIKSAQMLAITDFHTITHIMNPPVNLT